MFSRCTLLIFSVVIYIAALSQAKKPDGKFGNISAEDFASESYGLDSSADAVYLYDAGSARYNISVGFSIIYKIHQRIRLLHKKSFDELASIRIPLYEFNYREDALQDFQAATYTYENGKIITTKVDKNSIFKEKDGDIKIVKFTFPNLKEGCIIEYSYTKIMSNYTDLPTWNFQSDYPELWNEYTVEIPEYFDFAVLQKGYLTPVIDTAVLIDNYTRTNTTEHTWAFENVPALKDETYITDLSNYRQSVSFQPSALRFPGRETQFFTHTWYQTVDELMNSDDFGADLKKENGWLRDDIKEAVAGETDSLARAKKIYEFVRDNYVCTDNYAVFLSQPIKKTAQSKTGNVADINMLLIAMLKAAGFSVNPILLSTRGHGKTVDVYPIISKFNYLIAQVYVNNKSYLLDASIPVLGFDQLSEDCYNGNARTIADNPVIINLSADSLHETKVTTLFISNDENEKITGSYKCVFGQMKSVEIRSKMKKMNTEEYFKDVKKNFTLEADISNTTIDSLNQKEAPVSVQYDLAFKPQEDIFYFTPLMTSDVYKENPFKAAKRYYPVEMPYCMDEVYVMNMEVPAGYKVDELPKSTRVSLNDSDGMFEYLIQQSGDNIQLRCRVKLNKATFEPDDYETLRNFFAMVVEKESEQIVFKKQ